MERGRQRRVLLTIRDLRGIDGRRANIVAVGLVALDSDTDFELVPRRGGLLLAALAAGDGLVPQRADQRQVHVEVAALGRLQPRRHDVVTS